MSKTVEGKHEMFHGKNTRNLSVNLNCLFFKNITFLRLQLFFALNTHPVNSIFSVVVQINKILVIDEAFFPSLQP